MGLQEQIDEEVFDRLPIVADLVIPAGPALGRVLQPIHRALAGKRRASSPSLARSRSRMYTP